MVAIWRNGALLMVNGDIMVMQFHFLRNYGSTSKQLLGNFFSENKMIIYETCHKCYGCGWVAIQVGEYEWEQENCPDCLGLGKTEVEVNEETGMPK